ncbi:MAG: LamG domain-containing protein, partial [Bacteroidota bacterium]
MDPKRAFLFQQIDSLEQLLNPQRSEYQQSFATWKAAAQPQITERALLEHYPLDRIVDNKTPSKLYPKEKGKLRTYAANTPPQLVPGKQGKAFQMMGDNYVDFGNKRVFFERNQPFSVGLWVKILEDSVSGPIFGRSGGLMDGNRGYDCMLQADRTLTASLNHVWPDNSIEIQTTEPLPQGEWVHLMLTYDGSSRAEGLHLYAFGERLASRILNNHLEQSIKYPPGRGNWYGDTGLWLGRRFEESIDQIVFDEFKVFGACLTPLEVAQQAGSLNSESINEKDRRDYYLATTNDSFSVRRSRLEQIRGEENELISHVPEMMIMRDLPADRQRETFILNRGVYDQPIGDPVGVGTPAYV